MTIYDVLMVNGEALATRFDLNYHSPDGFEWGFNGSGPSQLALAVLAHEYGDEVALEYYKSFRDRVIARLHKTSWTMNSGYIGREIASITKAWSLWREK